MFPLLQLQNTCAVLVSTSFISGIPGTLQPTPGAGARWTEAVEPPVAHARINAALVRFV